MGEPSYYLTDSESIDLIIVDILDFGDPTSEAHNVTGYSVTLIVDFAKQSSAKEFVEMAEQDPEYVAMEVSAEHTFWIQYNIPGRLVVTIRGELLTLRE